MIFLLRMTAGIHDKADKLLADIGPFSFTVLYWLGLNDFEKIYNCKYFDWYCNIDMISSHYGVIFAMKKRYLKSVKI